ncbi:MAG: hypothetical protein LBK22_08025 [Tannerella sp.]|nr:hypothetical protein [Tannerella sp.]
MQSTIVPPVQEKRLLRSRCGEEKSGQSFSAHDAGKKNSTEVLTFTASGRKMWSKFFPLATQTLNFGQSFNVYGTKCKKINQSFNHRGTREENVIKVFPLAALGRKMWSKFVRSRRKR